MANDVYLITTSLVDIIALDNAIRKVVYNPGCSISVRGTHERKSLVLK